MIGKLVSSIGLLLCALICIFLIGRVILHRDLPLHTPHTTVQRVCTLEDTADSRQIALDSGALLTLISRQVPADFPIDQLSIQLSDAGSLALSGSISLDALALPRASKLLLPNPCTFSAILSVGYQQNEVVLHPLSLRVGGLAVPHILLEPITAQLAQALNAGLQAQGLRLHALSIQNQTLYIQLEP